MLLLFLSSTEYLWGYETTLLMSTVCSVHYTASIVWLNASVHSSKLHNNTLTYMGLEASFTRVLYSRNVSFARKFY